MIISNPATGHDAEPVASHPQPISLRSISLITQVSGSRTRRFNTGGTKPATGHDPEPVATISCDHDLFPGDPSDKFLVAEPEVSTPVVPNPPLDTIRSQLQPSPVITTYFPRIHLTKFLVAEPEGSTSLVLRLPIGRYAAIRTESSVLN
jgi:hypothetical protein